MIWIGTNDGLVQLTRDDGRTWTNLTANLPNLPVWGSVRSIVASKYDAGTAYLTVDFHQMNNRDPFVYRTTDFGRTWKAITSGLPRNNLSYAKVIHEDPKRRGLLYLGLENGIYLSYDAGDSWIPLQNDLPAAPVSGIQVQEHFNDLVISTYGRGFYILDDLGPLQQLTPEVMNSAAHLFDPRAAYRFRFITAPSSTYDDPTTGEDPQYGASLNYWLKAPAAQAPRITILDAQGRTVRTLTGTNVAGINRVTWDLRDEPGTEVRLRTSPMYAAHMIVAQEGRVAPGTTRISVLMAPGTYTVRLNVGGVEQTRQLEVRKDPNSAGTQAEIEEQVRMVAAVRTDMNQGAEAVHRIESVRVQLDGIRRSVTDADVRRAAAALEEKLVELEMNLVDLRQTGGGQDGVRFGSKLIAKLGYLANGLANADFKPTDQQGEVQVLLNGQMQQHLTALESLIGSDLNALNALLRQKNVPNVVGGPAVVP
jgi:hypothetical protein